MKIKVTIIYRDDKEYEYMCFDFPSIADRWITLYMIDTSRKVIPTDGVKEVNYAVV